MCPNNKQVECPLHVKYRTRYAVSKWYEVVRLNNNNTFQTASWQNC